MLSDHVGVEEGAGVAIDVGRPGVVQSSAETARAVATKATIATDRTSIG
jgi:hypothetical protein